MFDYVGGGIVSAAAGEHSKVTRWVNRMTMLALLLGTPGAAIFAIVRAVSDAPSAKDLALLGSFFVATGLGTTVGFHRLLTHRSFETHPLTKAVLLIFGTWAVQGAAITWAAIHEKHHVYSDTDEDPHSPVKNFFHGHMGWLFGTVRGDPEQYVKVQLKDPVVMFVSRTAFWWAILGLALPGIIGGWSGFLWGSMVRVVLVHHAIWSVNSIGHTFGSRPFKTSGSDRSTNHWLVALWALGEGWHNNHHAFPRSALLGLAWWQVDFGGYVIRLMGRLRLARSIYRVPKETIKARVAAA
jgi:stearoyl-CoA desaturase (delta-9 desaturase)